MVLRIRMRLGVCQCCAGNCCPSGCESCQVLLFQGRDRSWKGAGTGTAGPAAEEGGGEKREEAGRE